MPERPLLLLPPPATIPRPRPRRRMPRPGLPSVSRQASRLAPKFAALQEALSTGRAKLGTDIEDLVPEEVVVLETVGPIKNFIEAVRKVSGLELLAELEVQQIPPDDDFHLLGKDGQLDDSRGLDGRLFMIFTNEDAMNEMLLLWDQWVGGNKLERGFGPWSEVFRRLRDIRAWSAQDRLAGIGDIEDWQEFVERNDGMVPTELQLWYRHSAQTRRRARERVAALVRSEAGRVIAESEIADIGYHCLLVELPGTAIRRVMEAPDSGIELIQCEQIRFFRPAGQFTSSVADDVVETDDEMVPQPEVSGDPVIALLDGLPLQAHQRLAGRLLIDDPDNYEPAYDADRRYHGTAMASLIIHGDLNAKEAPMARPLYVRPVLQPEGGDRSQKKETFPPDVLITDLLYRAIRRLFEGKNGSRPIAPTVTVVNLSVGIHDFPFLREMSPLARLLDWLAWKYKVLFVISAGNHTGLIDLDAEGANIGRFVPGALEHTLLRAMATDWPNRRLLPPAEAINALTVGATHHDASGRPPPRWIDPYLGSALPSLINAQGPGYRRAIKPDILAPGGRIAVQQRVPHSGPAELELYEGGLAPGHVVASPGRQEGDTTATRHTRGTSNAAALVSRQAAFLFEQIEELRDEVGGETIDEVPRAIWLKALIVHSADRGAAAEALNKSLETTDDWRRLQENVSRILGYGTVDIERVRDCTPQRMTAIGGGKLRADEAQVHRVPLPPSLSGRHGKRRLTVTLAWLTPVSPRHQGWRQASLSFSPPEAELQVKRKQAQWQAVQRGTVQHEILEGSAAAAYMPGAELEIRVDCKADSGTLIDEVAYALVVSLEVSEEIDIDVYSEVRERIMAAHSIVATRT